MTGTAGTLVFEGRQDMDSAENNRGEFLVLDQSAGVIHKGRFEFEDTAKPGTGPKSLRSFVDMAGGMTKEQGLLIGADALIGLRSTLTIAAAYRAAKTGMVEAIESP